MKSIFTVATIAACVAGVQLDHPTSSEAGAQMAALIRARTRVRNPRPQMRPMPPMMTEPVMVETTVADMVVDTEPAQVVVDTAPVEVVVEPDVVDADATVGGEELAVLLGAPVQSNNGGSIGSSSMNSLMERILQQRMRQGMGAGNMMNRNRRGMGIPRKVKDLSLGEAPEEVGAQLALQKELGQMARQLEEVMPAGLENAWWRPTTVVKPGREWATLGLGDTYRKDCYGKVQRGPTAVTPTNAYQVATRQRTGYQRTWNGLRTQVKGDRGYGLLPQGKLMADKSPESVLSKVPTKVLLKGACGPYGCGAQYGCGPHGCGDQYGCGPYGCKVDSCAYGSCGLGYGKKVAKKGRGYGYGLRQLGGCGYGSCGRVGYRLAPQQALDAKRLGVARGLGWEQLHKKGALKKVETEYDTTEYGTELY